MNTNDVDEFIRLERARWFPCAEKGSDTEMLRQRERILNGLAIFFALLALVSLFWAGVLGWGIWGYYLAVAGAALLARRCSVHANRCGVVREFLQNMLSTQSPSALDAREDG
jgi:hypothetical protein